MTSVRVAMPSGWRRVDGGSDEWWTGPLPVSDTDDVPGLLWIGTLEGSDAAEMTEMARQELAAAAAAAGFTVGELEDSDDDAGAWAGLVAADGSDTSELVLAVVAWKRLDDDTFVLVRGLGASVLPHNLFAEFVFDTADSTSIDDEPT